MRKISVSKDTLWKSILDNLKDDAIKFFLKEYVDEIDFSKPIHAIDKELSPILLSKKNPKGIVDKLYKLSLISGESQAFLFHIESQDQKTENMGRRMYVYQYRIDDKFGLPCTALVIYTGKSRKKGKHVYSSKFMGTEIRYEYLGYDLSLVDLPSLNYKNIFSYVIKSAKYANENHSDDEIFKLKYQSIKEMVETGFDRKKIEAVMNFFKFYNGFTDDSLEEKLDSTLSKDKKLSKAMGIEEAIIAEITEKASLIGEKRGEKKGEKKGVESANLKAILGLNTKGISATIISEALDLELDYVLSAIKKAEK